VSGARFRRRLPGDNVARTINRGQTMAMTGWMTSVLGAATAIALVQAASPAAADSVEDFYRGKTITVISTGSVGSIYDLSSRLTVKYMAKHLPGDPQTIAKVMTGAGHLVGTNHLYNIAPKDGTTLGAVGETIPLIQVLQPEKAKYDVRKFNWLGNPVINNLTIVSWHTSGVTSIQQVFDKELIIGTGGPGSTSTQNPRALNNILGTKFKIISGFPGAEIDLAMERGEVNGRGGAIWSWWQTSKPQWIAEKKINILLQIGPRRAKGLENVPLMTELARNEAERRVLALLSSSVMVGRPILAPPNVPADRVAALRAAFRAAMTDREYVAEAAKLNLDIEPTYGDELQKFVEEIASTPPELAKIAGSAIIEGHIFNCKEQVKDAKLCEGSGGE
jgi:tripartite-type tricarboxylate transporter receptor subunit TctC